MSDDATMTFAAGGLVWRPAVDSNGDGDDDGGGGGVDNPAHDRNRGRLAVVHRPRYDDWSIPKGKLEPGELLPETAVREVTEETGCTVRRGAFAGRYQYDVASGPKSVYVWHMRLLEEGDVEVSEVDRLVWLTPDEALGRLSYDLERSLLERVVGADRR